MRVRGAGGTFVRLGKAPDVLPLPLLLPVSLLRLGFGAGQS
jgi:hypothetical protein